MKKITTVGGGTGTFVVLSGLKKTPEVDLTAIVSVADNGGSTGRLRDAYGYLPAGDLRQALVALAEDESTLRRLFSHRFGKGDVAGHNFGNLYLVALSEMFGSEAQALEEAGRLLNIRGRVIPVSDTSATLCAEYHDGSVVEGQHTIREHVSDAGRITRLFLKDACVASAAAQEALRSADLVILGPGDIYTSILANFVTNGLSEALKESSARVVCVMNLFTTPESGRMTMRDYAEVLTEHIGRRPDVFLVNSAPLPEEAIKNYALVDQYPVVDDLGSEDTVVRADLLSYILLDKHENDVINRSMVRHDSDKLAHAIMAL